MKSKISKIIVGIDFSGQALNAVNTAIHMSKLHGATLHLHHVVDGIKNSPSHDTPYGSAHLNTDDDDVSILTDLTKSIQREHGIICTLHHTNDISSMSICEIASQLGCDLIIVPKLTKKPSWRFPFDSPSYRIFKHAKCSVLIIPAEKKVDRFKNILFPLRANMDIHEKYNFSKAIIKESSSFVSIMGVLEGTDPIGTKTIRDMVARVKSWMSDDGIDHTAGVVINAEPAEAVLELANTFATDLMIINATSKRNIFQYFFGNYTQILIGKSEIALLCFRSVQAG